MESCELKKGVGQMTDNQQLMQEALQWKMHFLRKDSMFERFSKRVQTKVNERIPEKIHTVVTESVKNGGSDDGRLQYHHL